jgi:hypothetical protein
VARAQDLAFWPRYGKSWGRLGLKGGAGGCGRLFLGGKHRCGGGGCLFPGGHRLASWCRAAVCLVVSRGVAWRDRIGGVAGAWGRGTAGGVAGVMDRRFCLAQGCGALGGVAAVELFRSSVRGKAAKTAVGGGRRLTAARKSVGESRCPSAPATGFPLVRLTPVSSGTIPLGIRGRAVRRQLVLFPSRPCPHAIFVRLLGATDRSEESSRGKARRGGGAVRSLSPGRPRRTFCTMAPSPRKSPPPGPA